jgi:S-adenosylmethionine-diacylglycerol 3-amino-3-carboxypropyl transferase
MSEIALKWRKIEFESRIFISISIVAILSLFSFVWFNHVDNNLVLLGSVFGISAVQSLFAGYIMVAFLLLLASLLRMWAGSHLSSSRIMAFKVQHDVLSVTGPFRYVRNPVYLADMIAYSSFALCLTPVGLLLPLLIWIHYRQLIRYEEWMLLQQFGNIFLNYREKTPMLIPRFKQVQESGRHQNEMYISYDGFRNNALYLLFVPGFILASLTGVFAYAVIVGLPAVLDWAIIHTVKGVASYHNEEKLNKDALTRSKMFKKVLYAQCWEDPEADIRAFEIEQKDVIFSITSGGCNVLAFLTGNPKKVIALDLNPYQNYVLELKMAAFQSLSYERLLEFLGIHPCRTRIKYYQHLRNYLSSESRAFWDQNTYAVNKGIIHCGHFEGYMHLLKKAFNLVMGKSLLRKMETLKTVGEREKFYDEKWKNWRWKFFTRMLLSRWFMSFLFDKAFFSQLEENFSFGKHFEQIIKHGVTRFPLNKNSFLRYMVYGNYHPDFLPVYLRKENYEIICSRLNRIEIINGDCLDYFLKMPASSISKFNFTNIFEWMPKVLYEQILQETIRIAREGSILTYRNLLVSRSRPPCLSRFIVPRTALSRKLHEEDKSFIYRNYVVEQIAK